MSIDTTIDQYRQTKDKIASIIDRHMRAALSEIKQEFGDTPTSINIHMVTYQEMQDKYPRGIYDGCSVSLGGE